MAPRMIEFHADRRRGVHLHQVPLLPVVRQKAGSIVLSQTKQNKLIKRKSLNSELESRRRVKFSFVKTALLEDVPIASDMSENERSFLWWNKDELSESFRSIEKIMSSMSYRPKTTNGTSPYLALIYRIEEACRVSATSCGNRNEPISNNDLKLLADWHRNSLSKRGLEKLVLHSHEKNVKVRSTIIHATRMMHHNPNIDESIKLESIRACSVRLTAAAQKLAEALGKADADCVRLRRVRRLRRVHASPL